MQPRRKGKSIKEHLDYMNRVVPKLLAAEKEVEEIKGSKEWKRHYQYFQTLYNRGQLLERPTKENGYKIELGNAYVTLGSIEDLLTPEQIEKIKERIR